MKAIGVVAVVAAILVAGCAGPDDKPKGVEADRDIDITEYHLVFTCTYEGDASKGIHVRLKECASGTLVKGKIVGLELTWTGTDNAGGWSLNDRQASIISTTYYPGHVGNSDPQTVRYSADNGDEFTMSVSGKQELFVYGDYQFCQNLGGQSATNTYRPGYQFNSDPTQPDPTCTTFRVQKEGLI